MTNVTDEPLTDEELTGLIGWCDNGDFHPSPAALVSRLVAEVRRLRSREDQLVAEVRRLRSEEWVRAAAEEIQNKALELETYGCAKVYVDGRDTGETETAADIIRRHRNR